MNKTLKSVKPQVFKFEKGQNQDCVEGIVKYIMDLLLDYGVLGDVPKVKQKTYITIQCAKEVSKE